MTEPISSPGHLRKFGLTVGGGLAILGAISWYRGHDTAPLVLWGLAAVLGLAALVFPRGLAPVERFWMKLGHALAWVNTRIILAVVFAVILVPVSAIMRLFRDPLDRKLEKGKASYWLPRESPVLDPNTYKRQF